ncbi:unnamed protein product [Closterium sp. NIES-54]
MACARVLQQQQQGQPQRQQLQHSRQWGPKGPRSTGHSSGSASSGRDVGPCGYRIQTGPGAGTACWSPDHSASHYYLRLDDLHRASEGLCVGAAATISIAPAFVAGTGATSQLAQLSFTLDSGASRCFFRDCTHLTPLHTLVTVALADHSARPVVAHSTTTLPCLAALSGFLTGYYTPSFSKNLVVVRHLHDIGIVTTFPLYKTVASCTVDATGALLATFHREPGSGLYLLHIGSYHTGLGQHLDVWGHFPVLVPCQKCYFLIVVDDYFRYTTVLPLRRKADVPTVLEPWLLARGGAQGLYVWGPSPVLGPRQERYFLIVVDDYSRYTTVSPLRWKADVPTLLEPWLLARGGAQGLSLPSLRRAPSGVSHVTPQSSPPQRPVFVMSKGVRDAVAKGEGAGAAGAGGVGSGGVGGVGVEVTPMEDMAASTRRSRPASPPGFPSIPQFPPRSSLQPVAMEPRGVPAGGTGGTRGVGGGGAGSGGAGVGGTGTVAPTPRTIRFLTREQRLLRLEREERERFERARQQQHVGATLRFAFGLLSVHVHACCDSKEGLSLFDLTSGASTAPTADADSTIRSQWLTHDATARLAVRNHLPSTERAHFSQYKSARALYDAVVAHHSSPTTAALSRLMLSYLFPDLATFSTVADLVAHLRTSDVRYRAALPTDQGSLSLPLPYRADCRLARGAPCCS